MIIQRTNTGDISIIMKYARGCDVMDYFDPLHVLGLAMGEEEGRAMEQGNGEREVEGRQVLSRSNT